MDALTDAPAGYRLLVQICDDLDKRQAIDYLLRTFGRTTLKALRMKKGHYHYVRGAKNHWVKRKDGWRTYIPTTPDWDGIKDRIDKAHDTRMRSLAKVK